MGVGFRQFHAETPPILESTTKMGNTPSAPNRRLVRSLLLTLSGGVALSFASQATAHAQDAGTASDGVREHRER